MESRRSTLQFVVATVILGSLGIFATQARLDARTIVFYRCLFGAIAMGIYCLFLGHFRAIPKQDFLLACGTGFLMLGNWVFFFEGILRVGVTVATIVYQVQPFIVLIAGAILFQERLGLTKVLLFLVALLGLILATGIKWNMIDPGSLLGVGFTLLGATLYAGVVLVGKGLKSVKPEIVTFIQCAVGVLTLPVVDPAILHTSIELRQWGWLSGLRRHSYRARLRIDLSCVAKSQIFHDCDPNIYLSCISDIFRLPRERQVGIADAVPRARHHPSFESRDHTRM